MEIKTIDKALSIKVHLFGRAKPRRDRIFCFLSLFALYYNRHQGHCVKGAQHPRAGLPLTRGPVAVHLKAKKG